MIYRIVIHSVFFILCACCLRLYSQSSKVDQARAQYISERIRLNATESQKFWPIYNEYSDKLKSIRQQRKKLYQEYKYSSDPSQSEQFINTIQQLETTEMSVRAEYLKKFRQILGSTKTADLLKAEEGFRQELVKILKNGKTD